MTSYYTPTQTHTSSIHDYYYASVSSSSSSVARPLRRSARPSPMAPSLSSSYVGTHAPTRTARPVRPTLSRTPASTPCAISYTPSYASARAHTPSPYGTATAASSRSSLRKPRASFDVALHTAHPKHVAFADQRPKLRSNNTWPSGPATPAAFPVKLPAVARTPPPSPPAPPPANFKMHPLLAHGRLKRALISYDVQHAPTSKALLNRRTHEAITPEMLAEPATAPALPCNAQLTLTHPLLPRPVIVSPSPSGGAGARHSAITTLDVLAALHAALHRPAGKAEWDALGTGSTAQRRVRDAFERRCASGTRENGLKRIDWLAGKTRLVGIEVDRSGTGATGRLVFASPK